jgi:hypothetical protein
MITDGTVAGQLPPGKAGVLRAVRGRPRSPSRNSSAKSGSRYLIATYRSGARRTAKSPFTPRPDTANRTRTIRQANGPVLACPPSITHH